MSARLSDATVQLVTRRALLARAGNTLLAWGLVAALPGAGCGSDRSERRVVAHLRQRFGDAAGVESVATTVAWSREQALQVLRGELSDGQWAEVAGDPVALDALVAERRAGDLTGGRTRYVNGWLLAETEIAVSVLAAP